MIKFIRLKIDTNATKKQKILSWGLIIMATVLLTVCILYLFMWRQPKQPQTPEEIAATELSRQPSQTAATPVITTAPEITPKPMVMLDKFKKLHDQNSDIVGWITVENTVIDYPILQRDNNSFYMDKDFYKEYSDHGSIFLDFRCDFNNMYKSAHQIIYGHNMKNGAMFQQLTKYQDEQFFKENRYINVNTLYGNYEFEVFAAYTSPVAFYYLETDFIDKDKWLEFIKVLQEKSDFETELELSGEDVIITLSTCTNNHDYKYRYIVHARLTNPEKYDMIYNYMY